MGVAIPTTIAKNFNVFGKKASGVSAVESTSSASLRAVNKAVTLNKASKQYELQHILEAPHTYHAPHTCHAPHTWQYELQHILKALPAHSFTVLVPLLLHPCTIHMPT